MFYSIKKLEMLPKTTNHSLIYWRAAARKILKTNPEKTVVEIVKSGRKTDSKALARGERYPPRHVYVVIASTGGKWGKSRRDFK